MSVADTTPFPSGVLMLKVSSRDSCGGRKSCLERAQIFDEPVHPVSMHLIAANLHARGFYLTP